MKAAVLALLLLAGCDKSAPPQARAIPSPPGREWVAPYYRSNGTRIEGYWRTLPDGERRNNWSAKGNVNPMTGKAGTREP